MTKRKELLCLLDQVTDENRVMFKRMYAHDNLDMEINNAVEGMTLAQVKRAIQQVNRTIEINNTPKIVDSPPVVQEVDKQGRVTKIVCDRIREVFYERKIKSARDVVGGMGVLECEVDGEKYNVEWDGFWEKSDWFSYHIVGEGLDFKGDYFYM